jgi:predicted PurR-regulated permease PerM
MSDPTSRPPHLDGFARFNRRLLMVILVVVAGALLWNAPQTPFLLLAAILFALLLDAAAGLVSKVFRDHVSRGVSLSITLVLVLGLIAGGVAFMGPRVSEQADLIREQLPRAMSELEDKLSGFALGRAIVKAAPSPSEVDAALNGSEPEDSVFAEPQPGTGVLKAPKTLPNATTAPPPAKGEPGGGIDVGAIFRTTFGVLVDLLVILIVGLYLAIDPKPYMTGFLRLVPKDRRERAGETLKEVETLLKRWLAGRLFSMMVVGVLTGISLAIAGIPFALTLGLLAGLLSFIPNLGPILAMVPGMLLALLEGGTELALVAGGCYIAVQFVESYLITPMVERHAVSIPPAMLIFAQLIAGVLFGGLGLILATPLLVIGMVVVRRVYIEGFLDDDMADSVEAGPLNILPDPTAG